MSGMGTVQEAVTSKLAVMLTALATFCAAFVVTFVMYWKTALIISPFFVTMIATQGLRGCVYSQESSTDYGAVHPGGRGG